MASLVVVKSAGISWFGIYSFLFIMSTLASAILSTMLHRQMLLEISTLEVDERRRVFLATLIMQAVVLMMSFGIAFLILTCRQYLYATDNQIFSFRCTAIYVGGVCLGLLWILFKIDAEQAVSAVFLVFSSSLAISVLSNRICLNDTRDAQWLGWRYVWSIFVQYFSQSRYRLVGLFVTWTQNQSMT